MSRGARATGQLALAGILFQRADFDRALDLCDDSIRLFQAIGDVAGIAHACESAVPSAINSGQLERGEAYLDQALSALTAAGDPPWLTRLISHFDTYRGQIAMLQGNIAMANEIYLRQVESQRALAQESGTELAYSCWPLFKLGITDGIMGRTDQGLARIQAALARAWRTGERACAVAAMMSVARILSLQRRCRRRANYSERPS